MSLLQKNAKALERELNWLHQVINTRMQLHFRQETNYRSIYDIPPPEINVTDEASSYEQYLIKYQLGLSERITIILALMPHIQPEGVDVFLTINQDFNKSYTEFGGIKGQGHNGFLPTIETVLFILSDNDLENRFQAMYIFDEEAILRKNNIIRVDRPKPGEPKWSATLNISEEFFTYFTTGDSYKPDFSSNFPAQCLRTKMEWEDLILHEQTQVEIQEIFDWIDYKEMVLQDPVLNKRIKPGYRALFYGPPGTGKTLSASLIGKKYNLDVYRIDLSQVVSKYIGETEKNMANIFDQAQNKNWILFFDEADALFGKRTATSDSKDRHANQEVAYLLQRIEAFPGVVILASNLKDNLDEAFARRFQSMIYFPIPGSYQRHHLWMSSFSSAFPLASDIDLEHIAQQYKITGGAIINVVRYCTLQALRRKDKTIQWMDIETGIARELAKEGKTI